MANPLNSLPSCSFFFIPKVKQNSFLRHQDPRALSTIKLKYLICFKYTLTRESLALRHHLSLSFQLHSITELGFSRTSICQARPFFLQEVQETMTFVGLAVPLALTVSRKVFP